MAPIVPYTSVQACISALLPAPWHFSSVPSMSKRTAFITGLHPVPVIPEARKSGISTPGN
jgi:hypothetical protein